MAAQGEAALRDLTGAQSAVKACLSLSVADIERKADEGDTIAMIARGDVCLGGKAATPISRSEYIGNLPAAELWYQKAYDVDRSILSIHRLALTLIYRDYIRRAVELYEEAALRGCCCAAYRVATLKRQGGWASEVEQRQLFERAVALGDIAARGKLGHMLLYGKGGRRDVWRAIRLLGSAWSAINQLSEDDPRHVALAN